jgi:hypothetical protein
MDGLVLPGGSVFVVERFVPRRRQEKLPSGTNM